MSGLKRKHLTTVLSTQTSLQRMYESGEGADLKIETPTRTFHVHKSVVCPASRFFHAACTNGMQETESGKVSLPEAEYVVDIMMRHFYGLELPFDPEAQVSRGNTVKEKDNARSNRLLQLVEVRKAADMYDIPTLAIEIADAFETQIEELVAVDLIVRFGALLYDPEKEIPEDTGMRKSVVKRIVSKLDLVVGNTRLWKLLYSNESLMQAVLLDTADLAIYPSDEE